MSRTLHGVWLGQRAYRPVLNLQQRLLEQRQQHALPDVVLVVEHPNVITLGRGAKEAHILAPRATLTARGVDVVEVRRGGDVTLHAPGQLVVYPIVDLAPDRRDVRRYVGDLTETMRLLARDWGIHGGPIDGHVGFWVDADRPSQWTGTSGASRPAKLGAIGVRISRWVTMHGFAFNLTTDVDLFDWIVPCGIHQFSVTTVRALTGESPSVQDAAPRVVETLAEVLGAEVGTFVVAGQDLDDIPTRLRAFDQR